MNKSRTFQIAVLILGIFTVLSSAVILTTYEFKEKSLYILWNSYKTGDTIKDKIFNRCLSEAEIKCGEVDKDMQKRFLACICKEKICLNQFCYFPEVWKDGEGKCVDANITFQDVVKTSVNEIVFVYEPLIKQEKFKGNKKVIKLTEFDRSNEDQYKKIGFYDVITVRQDLEGHFGYYHFEPCDMNDFIKISESIYDWTYYNRNVAIAFNILSMICVFVVVAVLVIVKEILSTFPGKCWFFYSLTSFINYCLTMHFILNYDQIQSDISFYSEKPKMYLNFMFAFYYFTEFSQYIGLNIMFFKILFVST